MTASLLAVAFIISVIGLTLAYMSTGSPVVRTWLSSRKKALQQWSFDRYMLIYHALTQSSTDNWERQALPNRNPGRDGEIWTNTHPYWLSGALVVTLLIVAGTCFSQYFFVGSPSFSSGTRPQVPQFEKAVAVDLVAPMSAPALAKYNASKALVRIGQLERNQYRSQEEYDTWAYSACSAAAMAEVMNAYKHHYRVSDVLKVEVKQNAITPELGLLEPSGIDRTVAKFGFKTSWLNNPSLDDVIKIANQGKPVIVAWPPDRYDGGHILVVRGGDSANVYLADSSGYNRQEISREQFSAWWAGFAVTVTPR